MVSLASTVSSGRAAVLPPPSLMTAAVPSSTTVLGMIPNEKHDAVGAPRATTVAEEEQVTLVPPTKSLRHALQVNSRSELKTNQPTQVLGHRGAPFLAVENTRESFLECAKLGVGVELDVFVTKDGTVIVFHGSGKDQKPGGLTGYVLPRNGVSQGTSIIDYTYKQAQGFEFDPTCEYFAGCTPEMIAQARIPTLEEVLQDLKPYHVPIKVELKGPGVVEPTLEIVEKLGMTGQCQFSSFDHEMIKRVRELRPQVDAYGRHVFRTGALFSGDVPDDFIERALAVGADEVHLRYDLCTMGRIAMIRRAGLRSLAWFRGIVAMKTDTSDRFWDVGYEDEACYQAVLDTGVDQMCVNRPDVLVSMLQEAKKVPLD